MRRQAWPLVAVTLAVFFVIFIPTLLLSRDTPKQARPGDIYSLPRWACLEIVDLRHQKVQLVREVARAYEGGKPKVLITFDPGDRRGCH